MSNSPSSEPVHLDIRDMREEYRPNLEPPSLDAADPNPFSLFHRWFSDANEAGVQEPNAMSLATCGSDGAPSVRTVLLKELDERGFVFFTNYDSVKGQQIEQNPQAALCFYWVSQKRQIRVEGTVEKIDESESDVYFQSRPLGSRIGAWASSQSRPLSSRDELQVRYDEAAAQFSEEVPRPPYWGGYRVIPRRMEFWQGRPSRLHDRIEYKREDLNASSWNIQLLCP